MKDNNIGLYIPREKLNTGNLEVALNYFLDELELKHLRFQVGLFEDDRGVQFGILLRNMIHVREPIREAMSMLSNHSEVKVVKESGSPSFGKRTPFSDWDMWKDHKTVSEDMMIDDEELPYCTSSPGAEGARGADEDEPCNDFR